MTDFPPRTRTAAARGQAVLALDDGRPIDYAMQGWPGEDFSWRIRNRAQKGTTRERAAESRKKYALAHPEMVKRIYAKWAASDKGKTVIAARIRRDVESGAAARKSREWRATKREWLHELKSKPCTDCGGTFDPVCMDYDHRPGEVKSFGVGKSLHCNKEKMLAEIAKCDLVCANCHRIRTFRKRDHRAICKPKPRGG